MQDLETKLTDQAKASVGEKKISKVHSAHFTNKLLSLEGGIWVFMLPFEMEYTPLKVNGREATNRKTYTTNLAVNYCPVCGEKRVQGRKNKEESKEFQPTANQLKWLDMMLHGAGISTAKNEFTIPEIVQMKELIAQGLVHIGKNHSGPNGDMYHILKENKAKVQELVDEWR
jgi:hypothetical protein